MSKLQKSQTKELVNDYIGWRLAKAGYSEWHLTCKLNLTQSGKDPLCQAMRKLAYEFEMTYATNYLPLGTQLNPSESNLQEIFNAILIDLFDLKCANGNCNWGRIVALFAFSACLAISCYEKDLARLVYEIRDWLVEFLLKNTVVQNWFRSQGYWNNLVEFELNRQETADKQKYEKSLSTFRFDGIKNVAKRLLSKFGGPVGFGFTIGFLGIFTLGFIFITK